MTLIDNSSSSLSVILFQLNILSKHEKLYITDKTILNYLKKPVEIVLIISKSTSPIIL
jgi:hypothetical protein